MNGAASERGSSPGWWLQLTGVGHAVVGVILYRKALQEIAADRLVGTVPDHGERATTFWFLIAAPLMWTAGRLLRAAEAADDRQAQRVAGAALTATGLTGAAAMPASGFWAAVAIGLATLRRGLRKGPAQL